MPRLSPELYLPGFVLAGLLSLSGCDKPAQKPQQRIAAVPVTAVELAAEDTPVSIEFVAKTASSRRVEVRSRVEGFLEARTYQEGRRVIEGEPMFQIDRKPFVAQLEAAQAELAQQEARLATAEADLARTRPLAKSDAIAKRELDQAEGDYRAAAAAVEAAQAKVVQAELNLGYTTIKAPVTGLSSYALQREGAFIGVGSDNLLTYVARVDPIWVEFSVSENQILQARSNQRKGLFMPPENDEYEVEIVLADGSVFPERGRITFSDASLSETTGTFLIRAELPNPPRKNGGDQLRPGQFVRVRLHGAYRPDAVLVPQRSVQQGAKGSFVWVIDTDGKAEFRPVTLGAWQGDQWFIDAGLQGNETIVIDGALKLRAGAPVEVIEADAKLDATRAGQS